MARKKTRTIYVTDSEIDKISDYFHKQYPFIYRENTIFSAVLVGMWKVEIREEHTEEVQSLLKPCEIKGFEL